VNQPVTFHQCNSALSSGVACNISGWIGHFNNQLLDISWFLSYVGYFSIILDLVTFGQPSGEEAPALSI